MISEDGLLPTDAEGNLLAGDFRAAENIALTSMQTMFVREHNRLADETSEADPNLTDEEIYQQAREIVIAELQSITYNEFLPALLGENALSEYNGYISKVDPSISNEFSIPSAKRSDWKPTSRSTKLPMTLNCKASSKRYMAM